MDSDPDNITGKHILIDRIAVPCHSLMQWAQWYETADRHVGNDEIGQYRVSTIFLGLDQSHGFGKRPILFETMVHGPESWLHAMTERYSTWGQAARGHKAMVKRVKEINAQISRLKDSSAAAEQPTLQEPTATLPPKG